MSQKVEKGVVEGEAISRPAELYAEAEVAAPLMQAALAVGGVLVDQREEGKREANMYRV